MELIDEIQELKYLLSVARGEQNTTATRLLRKEHDFYELRQVLFEVGVRLLARERKTGVDSLEPVEVQLAEAKRFIASIGGQLEDGARGVIEASRKRFQEDAEREIPLD